VKKIDQEFCVAKVSKLDIMTIYKDFKKEELMASKVGMPKKVKMEVNLDFTHPFLAKTYKLCVELMEIFT
jgi:hypothetical protein